MKTIADVFGQNLRTQRERADLSQEELGVRASLHRTEISLLERGVRLPRIDTLLKLAGGLEAISTSCSGGSSGDQGAWRWGSSHSRPARTQVPD